MFGTLVGGVITAYGAHLTSRYQLKALENRFEFEKKFEEEKLQNKMRMEALSKLNLLSNKLSHHKLNEVYSKNELSLFNTNCDQSAELIADILAYLALYGSSEYKPFSKIWGELSEYRCNLNVHVSESLNVNDSNYWKKSNEASQVCNNIINGTINILR